MFIFLGWNTMGAAMKTIHCSTPAWPAIPPTEGNSTMDYRVSYEHSLATDPDAFIAHIPSQLVTDVPATVPRALLPEFIADLIRQRSPRIGRIRNLRVL
jgi:hypothetical protein